MAGCETGEAGALEKTKPVLRPALLVDPPFKISVALAAVLSRPSLYSRSIFVPLNGKRAYA